MHLEYALFNLIVFTPFVCSLFLKRSWISWPQLIRSLACISLPFLIWDGLVTNRWWFFNPRYITGVYVGPLPWEEVIFYVTVPLSTLLLFTYLPQLPRIRVSRLVAALLVLLGIASLGMGHVYTASVLMLTGAIFLFQPEINIWQLLALVLLTLIFNSYLTTRPIVTYNPNVMTGLRLGTIPVEDFLFGWCFIRLFQRTFHKS